MESVIIYSVVILLCAAVVLLYLLKLKRNNRQVEEKIEKARQEGLFEPVSLHPVVDPDTCIQTGACIAACPEKDILGIQHGHATTINASRCIGHGACFHACPTHAITLCIGTEKRGVDLPHVDEHFETNVSGIYIAGELGGMGLIRNAVEQGRQAVENIRKAMTQPHSAPLDLVIVGAGPAGISASLTAKKLGLRFATLEQDTLGGTVFTFPRAKVVMTAPMELPLHGRIRLYETSKTQLLSLWQDVLRKHQIEIRENTKIETIEKAGDHFRLTTAQGDNFSSRFVLLAIGRRGTPRKLGIPGENSEKVAYRLMEPEHIAGKEIVVVGGGDSAIESALLLAGANNVVLSYRGASFGRIKPGNQQRLDEAISKGMLTLWLNSNMVEIDTNHVSVSFNAGEVENKRVKNDLVYIFAGGELPTSFLEKAGIRITKKFGEAILKHR